MVRILKTPNAGEDVKEQEISPLLMEKHFGRQFGSFLKSKQTSAI
jgi:hypothetical protein